MSRSDSNTFALRFFVNKELMKIFSLQFDTSETSVVSTKVTIYTVVNMLQATLRLSDKD